MAAPTMLPGAPPIVEGVLNVHGTLYAVIDPRTRFGHPPRPAALSDSLILMQVDGRRIAFHVDAVLGLESFADETLEDLRTLTVHAGLIDGAALCGDGLVLIHDPARFLEATEAASLDAVMSAVVAAP